MNPWTRRIAFWLGCLLVLLALADAEAGKEMSVQVRKGQIRAKPSFLGHVKATLSYGDRVEVVKEKGSWVQVKTASGAKGWTHISALSKKKIVLKAGQADAKTAADSKELALAGKGFNEEVEKEFKNKNKSVSFKWVDKMEKIRVSAQEMVAFLVKGKVKPAEGGAK